MLVAQRVNDWISQHHPRPICANCIVEAIDLSSPAHSAQITAALGTTSDFFRGRGVCSFCRNQRVVIRAA
jgi:hypothetical protein